MFGHLNLTMLPNDGDCLLNWFQFGVHTILPVLFQLYYKKNKPMWSPKRVDPSLIREVINTYSLSVCQQSIKKKATLTSFSIIHFTTLLSLLHSLFMLSFLLSLMVGHESSSCLSVKTYPASKVNVFKNSLLVSHQAPTEDNLFPPKSKKS